MDETLEQKLASLGPLPTVEEKAASEERANFRRAAELADAVVDSIVAGSDLEGAWWELTDCQRASMLTRITYAIQEKLPAPYGDNLRRSKPAAVAG